jgi:hypothetical protein
MVEIHMRFTVFIFVLLAVALPASAGVLTEDFNAPFPAWESGWLGVNSNLVNYYVADGDLNTYRGNNPDGLWLADSTTAHSGNVIISFLPSFAATLTSLSIDIAGYVPAQFQIFDATGQALLSDPLTLTSGAETLPGVYSHYSVTSTTGIGGFRFLGDSIEGNTSIDNVVVNQGETSSVPEPAALGLIGGGLLALAGIGRRRRAR